MSAHLPSCRVLHSNRQLPTFNYLLRNEGPTDLTNIYVMKHTGCGLTRTQQISNNYWMVWCRWPVSKKLLMIAGKWKCKLHFGLERKTTKNVNSAVVTIMVWVQANFITQNGIQFLLHLMKSHDLGIIQLALWLGKGRNLLTVSGTVTSSTAWM